MQRSNLKKRQSEMSKFAPDAVAINKYFDKIGSVLAAEMKPIDNKFKINRVKDTMVITPANLLEVARILKHLKNKKVEVMMESQMKFSSVAHQS